MLESVKERGEEEGESVAGVRPLDENELDLCALPSSGEVAHLVSPSRARLLFVLSFIAI